MNATEIAQVAHQAGFRGRRLETAVAVALAESGGRPGVNAVGAEDSRGLWQINSYHFDRYDEDRLYQPLYNARAAFDISDRGRDWAHWTTWREGTHRQHLDDARRAVRSRPWSRSDSRDSHDGRSDAGRAGRGSGGSGERRAVRRRPGARARRRAELAPWRVPTDGTGRTGRLVVTPSFLDELARALTGHLATAVDVDRLARRTIDDLDVDRLVVADGLGTFVRRTADAAVADDDGTRRLPRAFTRDVGYVIDAHRRAVDLDAARAFGPGAVDALVASLGGSRSKRTRNRVRRLLRQLAPDRLPTTPRRAGRNRRDRRAPEAGGGVDLDRVRLDRRWGGSQAVIEQVVTPFLRRRGLELGSTKRGVIPGSSTSSDHYFGNETAYARDYPTTSGEDDARALARRLGIEGWRPNDFQRFHVRIGGQRFRLQILWGAAIDHDDHVHVGVRRA